jgi:hypothetical protein
LISQDLSKSADKGRRSVAVGAIAESPLVPGVLFAGTDRGAFWVTLDDGEIWIERSNGLSNGYIRSICPSRFSESRVYVTITGINYDDLRCHLYVSEDFGETWRSIVSDLPDEVAYVIVEDPKNENILYAGLYRGVYISVDRGERWSLLGPGMAATAIADLVIQEREMDLIAGTHGRGIYRMNVRPIQKAFEEGIPKANILFEIPVARLPWINDIYGDPDYRTLEKVPITFYLMDATEVALRVANGEGKTVWSKNLIGKKGFNQFRWDLVVERTDSPKPYFTKYDTFAEPGLYEIQIIGNGVNLNNEMKIIGDGPR